MSSLVSVPLPQPAPRHDAIRALLRAGDNDKAIVQLRAITVSDPDDLLAKMYLQRALEYEQAPPDEAWEAVEVFKNK
jgi:hypothetical protein